MVLLVPTPLMEQADSFGPMNLTLLSPHSQVLLHLGERVEDPFFQPKDDLKSY